MGRFQQLLKRFHGIEDRLLDEIEVPTADKDASKR
jgi:hypothetical protein